VEWKHAHLALDVDKKYPLETSLVEWKQVSEGKYGRVLNFLGNFLSGMETRSKIILPHGGMALETSLVEWKHRLLAVVAVGGEPWKLP